MLCRRRDGSVCAAGGGMNSSCILFIISSRGKREAEFLITSLVRACVVVPAGELLMKVGEIRLGQLRGPSVSLVPLMPQTH